MISKWDMKQYIKKRQDKGEFDYIYNDEEENIYTKDGEFLASLDDVLKGYRKKSGESFESIYYEHAFLENVLRCTECGTVIFTTEDESYDPHLKCPTCTNYHTHFEYWTKKDIESDKSKQDRIKFLKEMMDYKAEQNKRIERRNGKHDWQIAVKKFYGKKRFLELALECDDITKSYFKGLRLNIYIGEKENANDVGYTVKKFYKIPLSWSQFYIRFIYKHKRKDF